MRSPWARRRKVDLADLIDEPWILAAPDSWNYRIITEAFRARGFNIPRIRLATFSVHLRADMIASGECITTFPGFVVRFFSARSAVKVLPVDLPVRPWPMGIVTLKKPRRRTIHRALRKFTASMGADDGLVRNRSERPRNLSG